MGRSLMVGWEPANEFHVARRCVVSRFTARGRRSSSSAPHGFVLDGARVPGLSRFVDTFRVALAAVAAALALVAAGAAAQAGEGPIKVTAPPRMVLGEQKTARINFQLPGPRDPKTALRVVASAGKIGDLSDSGLTFVGAYTAPETFFPQAAIIAATTRAGGKTAVGWHVLPLLGVGNLAVKHEPNASVTVRIGSESFGPVKADRAGKATVPVKVAPGYGEATVVESGRTIPLGVAPFKRIVALSLEETVPADGATGTEIRAFVIDAYGRPDALARVSFKPERGSTGPVLPRGPGVYATVYTSPTAVGTGEDFVNCGVVGDEASRDQVRLKLVTGSPRNLSVSFDPPSYSPGGPSPFVIATVKDAAGSPMNATVDFSADVGKFGPTRNLGPGRFSAPFSPPDRFEGRREVKVVVLARTTGGAPARQEASLVLKPGKPHRLDVNAGDSATVPADGISQVSIAVRVLDQAGNVVPGASVTADAALGVVRPPEANADGGYVVEYVPPLAFEDKDVKVAIRGPGGLRTEVGMKLVPAQRTVTIALKGGFTTNLAALNTPLGALEIDFRLRFISNRLFLCLQGGAELPSTTTNASVKDELMLFPGSIYLRYEIAALGPSVLFYLGAGGAGVLVLASVGPSEPPQPPPAPPPPPSLRENLLVLGGHALFGIGYRFGRVSVGIEAGYLYARAKGTIVAGPGGTEQDIGGLWGTLRLGFEL